MVVDWDEFLWHMERRLGMYVGRPRYERAFSILTGFDLGRGRGELAAFQDWLKARHSGRPLTFSALVLIEVFGTDADEATLVSEADHELAIAHLWRLLREFLSEGAG